MKPLMFETYLKLTSGELDAPPEVMDALRRVEADPKKLDVLLAELFKRDTRTLLGPPSKSKSKPRKKIRKGIGSY